MSDNLPDLDVPFDTPSEARAYIAREIERLKRHSNPRNKAEHRTTMRLINQMTSTWASLYRLGSDVEDMQKLAEEIQALKQQIMGGPEGLVDAADN